MTKLSMHGRVAIVSALVAWGLVVAFVVLTEARFPGTDIFLFKEAGINLANKGALVAANLNYMPYDQELPFANYPPVYPAIFGAWSWLFGVGLQQSLLFECVLRAIRSLFLGLLIWPWLKEALNDRLRWKLGAFAIFFLALISQVSTDNDRPDELGVIMGLLSWCVLKNASKPTQFILAGVFLGITAATSPACVICFAIGAAFFLLFRLKKMKPLFCFFIGGVSGLSLCLLPLLLNNPFIYKRFMIGANASSIPYTLPFGRPGYTWQGFVDSFLWSFVRYCSTGKRYIFCSLCLLFLSTLLLFGRKKSPLDWFRVSSVCFMVVSVFGWALQPYYLWFSCMPLSALLLVSIMEERHETRRRLATAILLTAFIPLLFQESKNFLSAPQRPPEEQSAFVRERVLRYVKPAERIAVSPDQYFTFRNYREIADVSFVCKVLDSFDYVYVTNIGVSRLSEKSSVKVPCWIEPNVACFKKIDELAMQHPLKFLGFDTGYTTRGHGGTLYKNVNCRRSLVASKMGMRRY